MKRTGRTTEVRNIPYTPKQAFNLLLITYPQVSMEEKCLIIPSFLLNLKGIFPHCNISPFHSKLLSGVEMLSQMSVKMSETSDPICALQRTPVFIFTLCLTSPPFVCGALQQELSCSPLSFGISCDSAPWWFWLSLPQNPPAQSCG